MVDEGDWHPLLQERHHAGRRRPHQLFGAARLAPFEKNPPRRKLSSRSCAEATDWLNADKARTLAEARKGFPMKPEALALALEQNKWDMDVALSETQALAKIGVDRKYVSRDVSADLPKVLNDSVLKEVIAGK